MHSFIQTLRSLLTSIIILVPVLLVSCVEKEPGSITPDISDIPSFDAREIFSMSEVEDVYFAHIGYESVVLENGNIIIPDRQLSNLIVIDEQGNLIKTVREGRGPGEIQDAYEFTSDESGNIYTYDQGNDKILVFDRNVDLVREMIPANYESTSLAKAYPVNESEWIFEMTSFEFIRNEDKYREKFFIKYDLEAEKYGERFNIKAQPYARLVLDGQTRGAAKVPYAPGTITAYNSENRTLFVFDTGTNLIAEMSAQFDTLNTILVNLPTEEVSSVERDSLEASYNYPEQWKTVQELLPTLKAPADKMLYHKGEFWLKSNIEAETEMWLVLNMKGQITRLVHLPKESMLMHVSEEHLGVRLDDVTFALFTNPKPKTL